MKKYTALIVSAVLSSAVGGGLNSLHAKDLALPTVGEPSGDAIKPSPDMQPAPEYVGPLSKVGRALHDNGIDVGLTFVNLDISTPQFGFTPGTWVNYGMIQSDVKWHISDLFQINFQDSINFPSHNTANYMFDVSNSFFPVPVVDSDTDLTRLTLQGNFFDGRLEVEGGRMGLSQQFMMPGFCGGIGCVNSTSALNLNIPGASLAEWGGRVGYRVGERTKIGLGVLEDNRDNWQSGSGWDWSRGKSRGYIAVANVSHDETFRDNANPLRYEVGAYHASASYDDALYNSGWGNPSFLSPTPTLVTHKEGTTGIYGQFRKVIWSDPSGGPLPENIAAYGGVFNTFGDGQSYPFEAYLGAEYSGFWDANPIASVGFTVHYMNLSEKRAKYEQNARLFFSGINQVQPRDMFQLDLHARVGLGKNAILEFGSAYMVNPNTTTLADFSTGRQKDGFAFYATLVFDLGATLGLSPTRAPI